MTERVLCSASDVYRREAGAGGVSPSSHFTCVQALVEHGVVRLRELGVGQLDERAVVGDVPLVDGHELGVRQPLACQRQAIAAQLRRLLVEPVPDVLGRLEPARELVPLVDTSSVQLAPLVQILGGLIELELAVAELMFEVEVACLAGEAFELSDGLLAHLQQLGETDRLGDQLAVGLAAAVGGIDADARDPHRRIAERHLMDDTADGGSARGGRVERPVEAVGAQTHAQEAVGPHLTEVECAVHRHWCRHPSTR